MRKLVIEKSAVKNNLAVIKERAAGAVIYGVLGTEGAPASRPWPSFSGTRVSATLRCLKCPRPRRCARPALWTRKS